MNKAAVLVLLSLLIVSVHCDSWVRLVHAVANGPNVDVLIDNNQVLSNVPYGAVSSYLSINDGNNVDFEIRAVGSSDALITDRIDINNNEYYTVVVGGLLTNTADFPLELLPFTDSDSQPSRGNARVRFIHASAGSPDVDFLINNDVVFENVNYQDSGNPEYDSVDAGSQTVQVNLEGTSTAVLGPVDFDFNEESVYTIFAIGIPDDANSPLAAIFVQDFNLFSDSRDNNNDDNNTNNNDNSSSSALYVSLAIVIAAVCAMF